MLERHPKQIVGDDNQIIDAIEGKTIAAADIDNSRVGIRFTDGSFVYVEACSGSYEGDSPELDWDPRPTPLQLVLLGVMTEEERNTIEEAEQAKREAADLAWKREQLARLKAELGET